MPLDRNNHRPPVPPELSRARRDAGRAGGKRSGEARRAAKAAAVRVALEAHQEAQDADDEPIVIADDLGPSVDEDGSPIPVPSRKLEAYPQAGEADRQLAWGRYLAGRRRFVELQRQRRQLVDVEEVRAWCGRVCAVVNRRLPAVLSWADALPGATDAQRDWLRSRAVEWEKGYRTTLAAEVIE